MNAFLKAGACAFGTVTGIYLTFMVLMIFAPFIVRLSEGMGLSLLRALCLIQDISGWGSCFCFLLHLSLIFTAFWYMQAASCLKGIYPALIFLPDWLFALYLFFLQSL